MISSSFIKKSIKMQLLMHQFLIDVGEFFNIKIKFYISKQKEFIHEMKKK